MALQSSYDLLEDDDADYSKPTLRNYPSAVRQLPVYLERPDAASAGIAEGVHAPTLGNADRAGTDQSALVVPATPSR